MRFNHLFRLALAVVATLALAFGPAVSSASGGGLKSGRRAGIFDYYSGPLAIRAVPAPEVTVFAHNPTSKPVQIQCVFRTAIGSLLKSETQTVSPGAVQQFLLDPATAGSFFPAVVTVTVMARSRAIALNANYHSTLLTPTVLSGGELPAGARDGAIENVPAGSWLITQR